MNLVNLVILVDLVQLLIQINPLVLVNLVILMDIVNFGEHSLIWKIISIWQS